MQYNIILCMDQGLKRGMSNISTPSPPNSPLRDPVIHISLLCIVCLSMGMSLSIPFALRDPVIHSSSLRAVSIICTVCLSVCLWVWPCRPLFPHINLTINTSYLIFIFTSWKNYFSYIWNTSKSIKCGQYAIYFYTICIECNKIISDLNFLKIKMQIWKVLLVL